jgi:hypothetical protein
MYIVAIHDVSDPEKFWGTIQAATIPEGIRLHSTLPNASGTRAVCLWEADSEEQIRKLVEGTVGPASENEYFEVKADNAMGLPA